MYRAATTRLGIVSTYLPRRCGLATYTADLCEALGITTDDVEPVVVAIDRDALGYGPEVIATIGQNVIASYEAAAEAIRTAGVDVVLIQHEYGIFGGPDGGYVLHLARALTDRRIPYLVTLHTLLSHPTSRQAATLSSLCAGAAGVTVFTETARRMAIDTGIAAAHQITLVPHGAPEILRADKPAEPSPALADLLDTLGDDPVLATFGLVSPGKGLADGVEALAEVVRRHPRTRYVIAGATHPEIVRVEGESYRESLHRRVHELGLADNVHFLDSFLSPAELSVLLHRTTIFLTPYRSVEQICSGALTFAVAAGCPVVSTAYRYAEDLLAGGAGVLVPCHDVAGLAAGINGLLDDPDRLAAARAASNDRGAELVWPAVALTTAALVRDVVRTAKAGGYALLAPTPVLVPPLRLNHLIRLTDELGIIEFCKGSDPDLNYGYNVDDVSRLGLVAAELLSLGRGGDTARRWVRLSVRFLRAAHTAAGRLHNRMTYSGNWTDEPHAGDHIGRAVWALGVIAGTPAVAPDVRQAASELLRELAPHTPDLAGLRSAGYALLGLVRAGHTSPQVAALVERLDTTLRDNAEAHWYWFEPTLTYDNARLAQALLMGAAMRCDRIAAARALTALDWYVDHAGLTTGTLRNVGNRWHRRDADPRDWADDGDEQPIDGASAVEALVEAWRYTGEPRYATLAGLAYGWFGGRNRASAALYDEATGACHDGLTPTGPNPNCGAESTLAHQQAMLSLLRAGLATLPDRLPVERRAMERIAAEPTPADLDPIERATALEPERTGTVRKHSARPADQFLGRSGVPNSPPSRPTHRTRTTEGQNDAR